MLRLAASLADGIPADLRDALTGTDTANIDGAARAMPHASGHRNGENRLSLPSRAANLLAIYRSEDMRADRVTPTAF